MESKNKMGYGLLYSEEPVEPIKEKPSPVVLYNNNDEDGQKEGKKKKKNKKKKGKKLRFRKTFWVCFSNIEIGPSRLSDDEKKRRKKKDHHEFKVAEDGFVFSNVEIEGEEEEDREKVEKLAEKMSNKSCFLVCFSNVQVGKDHQQLF